MIVPNYFAEGFKRCEFRLNERLNGGGREEMVQIFIPDNENKLVISHRKHTLFR